MVLPTRSFLSASTRSSACLSVLMAMVSAPLTPSLCRRLTVLPPAPPQPTMTIFGSPKFSYSLSSCSWAYPTAAPISDCMVCVLLQVWRHLPRRDLPAWGCPGGVASPPGPRFPSASHPLPGEAKERESRSEERRVGKE